MPAPKTDKRVPDLKSLARGFTELGISTLGGYITSPTIDPEIKVQAIKIMFDRGWGRPVSKTEVAGPDGEDIRVVIRTIIEGKK